MPDQPNKPGSLKPNGEPRDIEDTPAVDNQSTVTPDDYPAPASGDDTGGKDR